MVLLPASHSANLSDLADFEYLNDLPLPQIAQKEIFQTCKDLRMNKALGPEQIPNKVLKVIMPQISNRLEQIFNDSFLIGYYPAYFKKSIIIILRKEKCNRDFTSPKKHRPISFFNTAGKIIKVILVAKISYMATTHNLLPKTHFGGRRGSFIKTAIHYPLEKIYAA